MASVSDKKGVGESEGAVSLDKEKEKTGTGTFMNWLLEKDDRLDWLDDQRVVYAISGAGALVGALGVAFGIRRTTRRLNSMDNDLPKMPHLAKEQKMANQKYAMRAALKTFGFGTALVAVSCVGLVSVIAHQMEVKNMYEFRVKMTSWMSHKEGPLRKTVDSTFKPAAQAAASSLTGLFPSGLKIKGGEMEEASAAARKESSAEWKEYMQKSQVSFENRQAKLQEQQGTSAMTTKGRGNANAQESSTKPTSD